MIENQQFVSLLYLFFFQIAFINTKSQLFTLKNNKIILSHINDEIFIDEIFYIISTTTTEPFSGNTWTKESDNFDFTIDVDAE